MLELHFVLLASLVPVCDIEAQDFLVPLEIVGSVDSAPTRRQNYGKSDGALHPGETGSILV